MMPRDYSVPLSLITILLFSHSCSFSCRIAKPSLHEHSWDIPTKTRRAIHDGELQWLPYTPCCSLALPEERSCCQRISNAYDLSDKVNTIHRQRFSACCPLGTADLLGNGAAIVIQYPVKAAVETKVLPTILRPEVGLYGLGFLNPAQSRKNQQ